MFPTKKPWGAVIHLKIYYKVLPRDAAWSINFVTSPNAGVKRLKYAFEKRGRYNAYIWYNAYICPLFAQEVRSA